MSPEFVRSPVLARSRQRIAAAPIRPHVPQFVPESAFQRVKFDRCKHSCDRGSVRLLLSAALPSAVRDVAPWRSSRYPQPHPHASIPVDFSATSIQWRLWRWPHAATFPHSPLGAVTAPKPAKPFRTTRQSRHRSGRIRQTSASPASAVQDSGTIAGRPGLRSLRWQRRRKSTASVPRFEDRISIEADSGDQSNRRTPWPDRTAPSREHDWLRGL